MSDLIAIIITAILSPLSLKALEYFFSKSSEQSRTINAKIDGLEKRVDELKEKNFSQAIEIEVLKSRLSERDRQMTERDKLIAELKKELDILSDGKDKQ